MYVPLRVHGHHSFMTGVDSPAKLVARARELGLPGLALTEVDTLASLVEYLQATGATQGSTRSEIEGTPFQSIVGAEISDPSGLPGAGDAEREAPVRERRPNLLSRLRARSHAGLRRSTGGHSPRDPSGG